jgi:hypothetical protein
MSKEQPGQQLLSRASLVTLHAEAAHSLPLLYIVRSPLEGRAGRITLALHKTIRLKMQDTLESRLRRSVQIRMNAISVDHILLSFIDL